ncbi:MAG: hypothetical protein QOI42_1215 [Frankiaceae bacterium]|nr:hypothetical protein [Frankiaceae bacterium]
MRAARLGIVLGVLLAGIGAPAAHGDSATGPVITNVQMSTHHVSVSGLGLATVDVTAHITSDVPVTSAYSGCFDSDTPVAVFEHVSGASLITPRLTFPLTLTTGSSTDGDWTAVASVTSGWDGTWRLLGINIGDGPGDNGMDCFSPQYTWMPTQAEQSSYLLVVTGSNRPVITVTWSPYVAPVDAYAPTFVGRVRLQDGTPVAGRSVVESNTCSLANGGHLYEGWQPWTTDARGGFRDNYTLTWTHCFRLVDHATGGSGRIEYADLMVRAPRAALVTANVNATTVTAGRYIDVTGIVTPGDFQTALHVQRYVGGRWVDVATRPTFAFTRGFATRYRFHFAATPRGKQAFRVLFPAQLEQDESFLAAHSRTMTVLVR